MTDLKDTLAALIEAEPAAWLHTLHMELGQTAQRLSLSPDNPFGTPGRDYSAEYTVTSEPLYRSGQLVPVPSAGTLEKHVMVCPQCDGEGGYPDGVDEAACHTDCTRCGGNGWIVDTTAVIAAMKKDVGP